jgi:anti-sigma regulatory factor (Ser/Thr protein kinase)
MSEPEPPVLQDEVVLALEGDPAPARTARHFVLEQGLPLGNPDLLEAAGLVVTELVTNATLHTPGVVALRVGRAEGGLCVSVEDLSTVRPRLHRRSDHATTGRGMQLASAYAQRWGVRPLSAGKQVWAVLTPASVAAALAVPAPVVDPSVWGVL